MGITIHYKLKLNKVYVKDRLDKTQLLAESFKQEAKKLAIPFDIERRSESSLAINIDGCETLAFNFFTARELARYAGQNVWQGDTWVEGAWQAESYMRNEGKLPEEGYEIDKYPQNEIAYANAFCKTQYATSIFGHLWVAELIRSVASYCLEAKVSDEGDYYHSGHIKDATDAIESLGKTIANLGGMLNASFGAENIIKGGDTKIKSTRKAKK